jgi:hypothetical protein
VREILWRFDLTRRLVGATVALLVTLATVAAVGVPSALATSNLTVTTSFENTPVSLNTSDAVGYALANTSGSTQTVTFTNALPGGVTLDNPIAATNTAGLGACSTLVVTNPTSGQPSNPGDGVVAVSVSVPSVTGSSSTKPVCTISLSVVANTPSTADGALHDTYSNFSPNTLVPAQGSLVVLTNPVLTVTGPAPNQTFTLGKLIDASFGCAATDPLDSIASVFGTDDEGNQIQTGEPIDTVDAGSHSLEIDCYSAAGGGGYSQTINYHVSSYKLSAVRTTKSGQVLFKTSVPAGRFVIELIYGKRVIGTTRDTVLARKTASLAIRPTVKGIKALAGAARNKKKLRVQLHVAFTPNAIGAGAFQILPAGAIVVTRNVELPMPKR